MTFLNEGDITNPFLMLVEGDDDANVLNELARKGKLKNYEIRVMVGNSDIPTKLEAVTIASGFKNVKSLLIAVDADADVDAAFASIQNALRSLGIPYPSRPNEIAGGSINVSIILFPDGQSNGRLEDLCLKSVETSPLLPCIDRYIDCLTANSCLFTRNISKTKVYIYGASQTDPYPRLGVCAIKGVWNLDHSCFDKIVKIMCSLAI